MVRKQTLEEIHERCAVMRANIRHDIELETKLDGKEGCPTLAAVYRLDEHRCFSWEPGEYELVALFQRDGEDYYSLPLEFLTDEQKQHIIDQISGETDEDVLRREVDQRREAYFERKRTA